MKIFFDAEFTGLCKNTSLISLGMISENEYKFYAEFSDFNKNLIDDWISCNVMHQLKYKDKTDYYELVKINNGFNMYCKGIKKDIRKVLEIWLNQFNNVELVSDVGHYDMVLFIDIFGTAFDLPAHIAPAYIDINQIIAERYNLNLADAFEINRERIANIDTGIEKHNALYDAIIIKKIWEKLKNKCQASL